jgi:hypothetical protein
VDVAGRCGEFLLNEKTDRESGSLRYLHVAAVADLFVDERVL